MCYKLWAGPLKEPREGREWTRKKDRNRQEGTAIDNNPIRRGADGAARCPNIVPTWAAGGPVRSVAPADLPSPRKPLEKAKGNPGRPPRPPKKPQTLLAPAGARDCLQPAQEPRTRPKKPTEKKTRRGSKGKKNTCMIFAVSRRAETAQEAPKIAQTRPARRPLRRRDGQRGPGDEPRPPDGATTEKHRAAHILMSYIFGTLPCRIHS